MCRIFIFAKADNDHPNPALDWTRFKRGDVVDILEDGVHGGSDAESNIAVNRQYGLYRIIELLGVPAAEMAHLKNGVPFDRTNPAAARAPRHLRIHRIDLDAIENETKPTAPHHAIRLSKKNVLARRVLKPPLQVG